MNETPEVGEENGREAITLTATLKNSSDDGASEVLQAVLNSSHTNGEASRNFDVNDDEASAADSSVNPTAVDVGERFGWWNLLESATLQQSTENFFSNKSSESSPKKRWCRLEKKAAKVGRGLSKDDKALKLGLQHWLEAIDPQHRYGHNLRFYYEVWIKSKHTKEPFYYWLDVGEGKDIDLEECPRSKLQKELVEYLGPKEREVYEVIIKDGKLLYKMTEKPVHTPKGDRWIFVTSPSGQFYVARKKKGKFQHSSFLAGGVTTAAGRLLVNHGVLELMEAHSGHYLPTPKNFRALISTLTKNGADFTVAKVLLDSEEEVKKKGAGITGEVTAAPVDNNNEMAFEALLASAGFIIRSDTNAHFSKPDSGREDPFETASNDDEEEGYDIVIEVEKDNSPSDTNAEPERR